ncbi:MAG: dihydropteroate synthase-like protein [Candidatus Bathyarchaeia archaeon]
MKVLIVTGRLAAETVKKYAGKSGVECEVVSLPVDVAALIPQRMIVEHLRKLNLSNFELILTPGLMPGDVSFITTSLGINAFKGPRHAFDLPLVLRSLSKVKLSSSKPACEILKEKIRKTTLRELKAIYRKAERRRACPGSLPIGKGRRKIWIGGLQPPKVLAEIVDASLMSSEAIHTTAVYYSKSGADIIDVGMAAGREDVENAVRALTVVKSSVPNPVSIDTGSVEEIRAAVKAGVDLILSLSEESLKDARFAREIPVVVTPYQGRGGCPTDVQEKMEALENNIAIAKQLGFKWIIADPVLTPMLTPSLTESIVAYWSFRRRYPDIPLLFGAGNVTELMDGDSIGANLILAGIASELNASVILTTEASSKTRGCVSELVKAVKMMTLAKKRNSPPKDLGLDLLILKDKTVREELETPELRDVKPVSSDHERRVSFDPKGCFKIMVDRRRSEILLFHYTYKGGKPDAAFRGKDPLKMCRAVLRKGLISRMDHAAYLGAELMKAQVALETGKTYIQDEPLFTQ